MFRDFNLEKKIEALPSLSLEEFQRKKKQQRINKKKILQKLNTNKWCHVNFNNSQSNRQNNKNELHTTEDGEKSLLVGSQKRKARKQSITRNAAATTTSNMSGNQESKSKYDLIRIISYIECYNEDSIQLIEEFSYLKYLSTIVHFFLLLYFLRRRFIKIFSIVILETKISQKI